MDPQHPQRGADSSHPARSWRGSSPQRCIELAEDLAERMEIGGMSGHG